MNYRTAPARPDRIAVVRHRPMHPAALIAIAVAFGTILIVLVTASLDVFRSVELVCERGGTHTCDVRRSYGPITTHEAVPIPSIRSVVVTSARDKGHTTYGLDLVAEDRAVTILKRASLPVAESMRGRVLSMIRPEPPGTDALLLQEGSATYAGLILLPGAFVAFVLLSMFRTARLELHLDRGTIVFTRHRWPLSPLQRTLRLDEVDRARLDARPGSKGSTLYEVRLVLRDGEEIALVPHASGSESRVARTVTEINQHLQTMRGLRA